MSIRYSLSRYVCELKSYYFRYFACANDINQRVIRSGIAAILRSKMLQCDNGLNTVKLLSRNCIHGCIIISLSLHVLATSTKIDTTHACIFAVFEGSWYRIYLCFFVSLRSQFSHTSYLHTYYIRFIVTNNVFSFREREREHEKWVKKIDVAFVWKERKTNHGILGII